MCGVAGAVPARGVPAEELRPQVARMVRSLAHRGPDGRSACVGDGVLLGHTRLAIIGLGEQGRQPMRAGSWTISFNGEIYNHQELRGEVYKNTGGASDSEVLVRHLERFGLRRTLERLKGIFAFAAHDRTTGDLHLVVDRLGVKPLVYADLDRGFLFASTPAAIARSVDRTWRLDRVGVRNLMALGGPFGEHTLFEGIRRMPPASVLTRRASGALQVQRYWEPSPSSRDVDDVLDDAIDRNAVSDVDVGLFFSGGVDSSVLGDRLRTLKAVHFGNGLEVDHAKGVADHLGLDLVVVPTDSGGLIASLDRVAATSGEASASAAIPHSVARLARQMHKVTLSANGADELFGGYSRTPLGARAAGMLKSTRLVDGSEEAPPGDAVLQTLHVFRHPSSYLVRGCPSLAMEQLDELRRRAQLPSFPVGASERWFELTTYVQGDLNPTLDHASMAEGLEVRVPFLEHDLVEAALSLEAHELVDSVLGRKAPLKRRLLRAGVPAAHWSRRKQGFSVGGSNQLALSGWYRAAESALVDWGVLGLPASRLRRLNPSPQAARDLIYLRSAELALWRWGRYWRRHGVVM